MKIKKNYYCITDNYNKPDFRFLFQEPEDAKNKIRKIKNSLKGETVFLSEYKRDFFVDGIKRSMISPTKKVHLRRGCWTSLKVKKLSLVESMRPECFFPKTETSSKYRLYYSKSKEKKFIGSGIEDMVCAISQPVSRPFEKVDWQHSILATKSFAMAVAIFVLVVAGTVFFINHKTNIQIAEMMMESHALTAQKAIENQTKVLGAKDQELSEKFDQDLNKFVLGALQTFEKLKQEEFEREILKIVKGSPMEKMATLISKQDRTVAAFLVGIAKKESNFGRRVPVLNGEDCFNYWGYRGIRPRMGTGGHTCFDSPEDAIATVGGRLQRLVHAEVTTPQEMVLWKCGSACASDPGASKWISDVNIYFSELKKEDS